MRLIKARVQNYRSVEDSGEFDFQEDVTCLVGKNESGKTAVLQALHLLNPLNPVKGRTDYDEVMDYPSRRFSAYKKAKDKTGPATVLTAKFRLDDEEVEAFKRDFGSEFLLSPEITVKKAYGRGRTYECRHDESAAVAHLVSDLELASKSKSAVTEAKDFSSLLAVLEGIEEPHSTVTELIARIKGWRKQQIALHVLDDYLDPWLPRFFYFDDYNVMRGNVSLPHLRERQAANTLDPSEETFLALLSTVDANLEDLENTGMLAEGTDKALTLRTIRPFDIVAVDANGGR